METVKDLGSDYQLIDNREDIENTLYDIGYGDIAYEIGCLFISFEDPQGGIEGYRIFVCENEFPRNNDWVWEVYPNRDY